MALATPEAWLRLLARGWRWGGVVRFCAMLLSLAAALFVNAVQLPERLLMAAVVRLRLGRATVLDHDPGVIVILGYYRSGTTHLHNLMSCDRRLVTPRWAQVLLPQGFWGGWQIASWLLIPLMGNTRPQDAVGFGPSWPAEDDFGMCNWALASSLPGRLVMPSRFAHYSRWQYMEELTESERQRWRRLMCAFCWKVTRRHPRRALLLKSPSHTSRVKELRRLFADRVQFVVIERDRDEVIASHVSMSKRLGIFNLEKVGDESTLREMIAEDHDRSIEAMNEQLQDVASSRVVRLTYDDLRANPIRQLQHTYEQLELGWDDSLENRVTDYLEREGEYTPRHAKGALTDKPIGHTASKGMPISRRLAGIVTGALAGGAGLALWMWLAHVSGKRLDLAAWPVGFAMGLAAVQVAKHGDRWLGVMVGAVFVLVALAATYLLPEVTYGWVGGDRWIAIGQAYAAPRALVWSLLGLVTAYRCASRRHARPPG